VKINTDWGELEVPEVIIREWEKCKKQYGEIEDFISEKVYEYLMPDGGKLLDRDLAIFLRDYVCGHTPPWGGRFDEKQFSFKDGGNKYTILAFGWSGENGKPDIHMVGYKEHSERKGYD